MAENFIYDVFLSHSAKDKAVVRHIAERLRSDGLRVWFEDWEIMSRTTKALRAKKIEEGLEHSRVLVLCMSADTFGPSWFLSWGLQVVVGEEVKHAFGLAFSELSI